MLAAAMCAAASCSRYTPPPVGPVADITVGPGLSVVLDSGQTVLVSVATVKGAVATPTYAGRFLGHGGTNKAGDKPADADVRLRFAITNTLPGRGEAPAWFVSASEKKIAELSQADRAEFIYKGGVVTLTVSSDGKSLILTQK